jgi:hypothetical protein
MASVNAQRNTGKQLIPITETAGDYTFIAEVDRTSRSVVKLTVTGPKITAAALRLVDLEMMAGDAWMKSMGLDVISIEPNTEGDYRIPDKHEKGSRFWWTSFAELWLRANKATGKPNPTMAEANGVSVSTIRSWVAAARARDLLPPSGRSGVLSDAMKATQR